MPSGLSASSNSALASAMAARASAGRPARAWTTASQTGRPRGGSAPRSAARWRRPPRPWPPGRPTCRRPGPGSASSSRPGPPQPRPRPAGTAPDSPRTGPGEGLGPRRRRLPPQGQGQELLQPAPALGQVPALLPEPPQRPRRLLGPVGLAGVGRPPERGAQVGLLQVATVQPLALVGAGEVRLGGERRVEEVLGVAPPDLLQVAVFGQPLLPELADRLQHGEPGVAGRGLGPEHQRLVDQRGQAVEDVQAELPGTADRLGRLQRPAAGEHRQPGEQSPLGVREQVVAPGDGAAQGPLPVWEGPGPGGQQREAPLQAGQDLLGSRILVRVAASSMARGSPSSRAAISATAGTFWVVNRNSGRTAWRARRTAGPPRTGRGRRGPGAAAGRAGPAAARPAPARSGGRAWPGR